MNYNKIFAQNYDKLMDDVPYDLWAEYIKQIWKRYDKSPELVLDLACGTGNFITLLKDDGYDMIGVDKSAEMLSVAIQKSPDVLFLNQDMRDLDLFGTVDSCVCIFDSLNYILDIDELECIFSKVNNFLNPKGLFIFDLNTEYKFKHILSDNSYSKIYDDIVCVFESTYDESNNILEYYTNFFIEQENELYVRSHEFHYEKAYDPVDIINVLIKSNFKVLNVFDAFTFDKPKKDSQRLYFIAEENQK